eukprot:13626157-Ditylum_brightwellii.AAC.1
MEQMTEPTHDPTYNPTAIDAENTPIEPDQEQEVDNNEEDEEHAFKEEEDAKYRASNPPKHLKKEITCVKECVGLLQHQRSNSRARDWRRENRS